MNTFLNRMTALFIIGSMVLSGVIMGGGLYVCIHFLMKIW